MKRLLRTCFCGLVSISFHADLLAQAILSESEVDIRYEDGGHLVRFHLHPSMQQQSDRQEAFYPPFDVFMTTNPAAKMSGLDGTNWTWVRRTHVGETNLIMTNIWIAKPYFLIGTLLDSDNDLLTDAYEIVVSHTDPAQFDSIGNGVCDGDKLSPNGLPWHLEQAILSSVAVYANLPIARQGGDCGQYTIFLPHPAPAGGTTVHYRFSGSAGFGKDFVVAPTGGQNFSDQVLTIPAGQRSAILKICAGPDNNYSPIKLYADLTLTSASDFSVDGTPAEVNIIKTGLPHLTVYALPSWQHRPCPTYGTNVVGFYFVRGGESSNALTINLSTVGSTAITGRDYAGLPNTITFPAEVRTNWLPLSILPNNTDPDDKKLVLTITHAPGYLLDKTNSMSTITIAATPAILTPRP